MASPKEIIEFVSKLCEEELEHLLELVKEILGR